jgi:hypothetical protein
MSGNAKFAIDVSRTMKNAAPVATVAIRSLRRAAMSTDADTACLSSADGL